MADTAAAPAPSTAEAPEAKQQFVRPEKPDETVYKDELHKLEKTHSDAQAKFVSAVQFCLPPLPILLPVCCPRRGGEMLRMLECGMLRSPAANGCLLAGTT
jgi:hypothetical protein